MTSLSLLPALAGAAMALSLPAHSGTGRGAREPGAEDGGPIVVTGARQSREEARRQAIAFIQGTGVAAGDRPVARWTDPVCIRVTGIADEIGGIVAARMARNAAAAGIPVARGACQANVLVSFTSDADALVQGIAARAPRRLAEASGETRARLLQGTAPIRWWYTTGMRSRHGMSAGTSAVPFSSQDGAGTGPPLPDVPATYQYNSSIVSTQVARALLAATVVIDANRAEGLPLAAVADFAAMVAFAEIRENDFASPASILGMFSSDPAATRAITEWDVAFLRALYRLPLDRVARQHRGLLVRDLLAAVAAEN